MNTELSPASSVLVSPPTATSQPVTGLPREITPNPDQSDAIDKLLAFVEDPDPKSPFFLLGGFAGTGKTFCMRTVLARTRNSRVKFAFTAPTNKAAKVLRAITGKASTIYSLLGLRIDKSGELKELVTGEVPPDLSEFDVIVIDEAGMVNKTLMQHLRNRLGMHPGLKVVFMGDEAQLPPVGEDKSPIWTEPKMTQIKLTKVERHDNQILTCVTHIREQVFHVASTVVLKSDNADGEGVWKLSKADFKRRIYEAAADGRFSDSNAMKVVA